MWLFALGVKLADDWQERQLSFLQEKAEYVAKRSFFELALKEPILADCFRVLGREFQCFGKMYEEM